MPGELNKQIEATQQQVYLDFRVRITTNNHIDRLSDKALVRRKLKHIQKET